MFDIHLVTFTQASLTIFLYFLPTHPLFCLRVVPERLWYAPRLLIDVVLFLLSTELGAAMYFWNLYVPL